MTLLATVLATLLSFLNLSGTGDRPDFISKDQDLRDTRNQQAFHEEEMFSSGQMGHCPHG
ncbi:MAG: hypothetical protein Q8O67_00535 [Deltaproteobacteria bacterium]|nr:hypothetical protein [Deltaproteobacteria bacterium]